MKLSTKAVISAALLVLFLTGVPIIPFQTTLGPGHAPPSCTEQSLPCPFIIIQATYHGYGSITYVLLGFGIHAWV